MILLLSQVCVCCRDSQTGVGHDQEHCTVQRHRAPRPQCQRRPQRGSALWDDDSGQDV